MTDAALPATRRLDAKSDAAKARVRARYRAETRFKFYGLAAIALAATFLVLVLTDILIKGLPAFTQHSLRLDVAIDAKAADPQGAGNLAAIRDADFAALVRTSLRAQFPEVTDRAGRRALDNLLSLGAGDALRQRVLADPKLLGQTVSAAALLSDDADLYYKGIGTEIGRLPGRGSATPSATSGEITIDSSGPDFAPSLGATKQALLVMARTQREEALRLRAAARQAEQRNSTIDS